MLMVKSKCKSLSEVSTRTMLSLLCNLTRAETKDWFGSGSADQKADQRQRMIPPITQQIPLETVVHYPIQLCNLVFSLGRIDITISQKVDCCCVGWKMRR